ncbi:MarR family transcriptional regulator [Microbacterium sp. KUDC0406]|uniref:MarR family winged helix-turn-helix transcriptional regulator n=1 Tax=Microbacterium sp. KUDC0406 TaxID=2909588 RepID=UPI001F38C67B|nr:MarR family transcriptional regulator [Microbacterium sp. KUDC0406]UJP11223.1 MarR family transcriptional regulator [Microbacterium sp. KUDC0406]
MDDNDRIDALVGQWADQRPDIDRDTMALLARLSRAAELANARTERLSEEYGVNKGDGDVMFALRRSGAPFRLSPTALARGLLMTTGTMTGRLDRLEKRGFIARVPRSEDRRSLDVVLTEEGLRLVDEAVAKHDANLREIASVLTADDRAELDRLTRTLITHLSSD